MKIFYNLKFKQWEANETFPDGSYAAVWGNTAEEVMEKFKLMIGDENNEREARKGDM